MLESEVATQQGSLPEYAPAPHPEPRRPMAGRIRPVRHCADNMETPTVHAHRHPETPMAPVAPGTKASPEFRAPQLRLVVSQPALVTTGHPAPPNLPRPAAASCFPSLPDALATPRHVRQPSALPQAVLSWAPHKPWWRRLVERAIP